MWKRVVLGQKAALCRTILSCDQVAALQVRIHYSNIQSNTFTTPFTNTRQRQRSFSSQDPRIQPRPPGEAEVGSKFPLPDKDKELELGRLQNDVQDLFKAGQYSKALEMAQTLLQETQQHFTDPHPAIASAHNNVGLMHKLLGDFDESRRHYQAALQIYQKTVGTDHASYASILHNLGNLNRNQVHFDGDLKATDRLSLMESAAEYLEQAYEIRLQERGPNHPHTVASRSSWGATLAAQLLHSYKMTSTTDPAKKRLYVSLLRDNNNNNSNEAWEAAHEHLRQALKTAVHNPRGPRLSSQKKKRGGKSKNHHSAIQTLSAAAAAQNLAIFLKARAMTTSPHNQAWLDEAHELYQDCLKVRTQLLPQGHPDLYATQHSLAELLEVLGDEQAANSIRQEIVDTLDPVEEEDQGIAPPSDEAK